MILDQHDNETEQKTEEITGWKLRFLKEVEIRINIFYDEIKSTMLQ